MVFYPNTSKGVEPAPRAGLTWEDQLGENLQEGNCLDISGGSKASKQKGDIEDADDGNDDKLKGL